MMGKYNKSVSEEIRVLSGHMKVQQKSNEYLYSVQLDLLDDRTTANGWRYTNLDSHRTKFAGIPILIAYTKNGRRVGDGHNFQMKRAKDGSEYASFVDAEAERIIGCLSDLEKDIKIEVRDGHKWIVGSGSIWAWYAREAVEKLASQGSMDVSIETLVTKSHFEDKEEVEEEYIPLGVTILGDGVPPAVRGADIRPLSQIDVGELRIRAASYIGEKPKETSKGVQKIMNSSSRMKELAKMFPAYKVMGTSEDGLSVALCSMETGDVKGYTFLEGENAVMDTRFCDANSVVETVFGEGVKVQSALDSVIASLTAKIATLSEELESEKKGHEATKAALNEAKDAIVKRNREDAKKALKRTLAEINEVADEDEKVDEKACEDLEKCIDEGEFDGECNAAEKVCEILNARIMKERTEKKIAAKKNNRVVHGWDKEILGASENDMSDTDKLLKSFGVEV